MENNTGLYLESGCNELLENIEKIHTTEMGVERIKKNLSLTCDDALEWCKKKIKLAEASFLRKGKNWYVEIDSCIITINAHSYTIITAHKKSNNSKGEKNATYNS